MEPWGGGEVCDVVDGNHSRVWRAGAKQFHRTPPRGNRCVGELSHTPHTRLVLRGTQNQPKRAKIRAETVERRWMRVVELANAHMCGR